MSSWNNISGYPSWSGNATNVKIKNLNTSSINADIIRTKELDANELNVSTIHASNIFGYNNYLDYIENINIITNVITLDNQGLTATPAGLYLNGELIGAPSTISSIADWSKFKAQTDVDMALSSIKNIKNLSATSGSINDLSGNNKIKYPFARLTDISANTIVSKSITTSSITTNDMVSEQIYNQFEVSTYSVYAQLGVYNTLNSDIINNSNVFNGNIINCDTVKSRDIFSRDIFASTVITNYVAVIPDEATNNGVIFADSNNINAVIQFQYPQSTFQIATEHNIDMLSRFSTNIQSLSSIYFIAPNINATCSNFYIDGTLIPSYISTTLIDSQLIQAKGIQTEVMVVDKLLSNTGHSILSSIQTNYISAGSINVSSVISSNAVFNNLLTNNISNTSNLTTFSLTATDNANLTNLTANTLTVNNGANYNTYISFATNNSGFYGAQYLYDINSLRNLQVEKITVLGGWTGNDIEPPYYNDSIIEVGEDIERPGQVIINGFNPDPFDPGIALIVRGDAQIVQNLGVLGEVNIIGLTTIEGDLNVLGAITAQGGIDITGDVNIDGALEVVGITNLLGDTNVGGILVVAGETNLAGALTCEAGIGIAGAMGLTGGNVVFGSGIDTGRTFTTYYETTFNNNLNAYDVEIRLADGKILGDSNSYLKIGSISTTNIQASNFATNSVYTDNIYSYTTSNITVHNNVNMNNNDIVNVNTVYLSNLHGYPDTDFIVSYKNFNMNCNLITNVSQLNVRKIEGLSNLDISGNIVQMDGSINFGTDCNRAKNFNCFYNTIFQDAVYVGQESNTSYSFNSFGDVNFGNPTHTSKAFINYYDTTFSNIVTDINSVSNIVLTAPTITYAATYNILQGNVAMDYLSALYNPSIYVKNDLDLSGNALLNVNYIGVSNIFTQYTNSNSGGYIENGIIFLPKAGDSNFWMLVKPNFDLSGGEGSPDLPGSEGLQIVQRNTADGAQQAIGRIYDNTIYTPWAHVTSNLNMSTFSIYNDSGLDISGNTISNVGNMYYGSTKQPFIQSGYVSFAGSATQTITLPVEYNGCNYIVQGTYAEDPGASAKPIHIENVRTSNFDIVGTVGHSAYWTAFGDV